MMYVYLWFIVLRESLLTVRLAVSEIKPVQSLSTTVTLAAHAREGLSRKIWTGVNSGPPGPLLADQIRTGHAKTDPPGPEPASYSRTAQ